MANQEVTAVIVEAEVAAVVVDVAVGAVANKGMKGSQCSWEMKNKPKSIEFIPLVVGLLRFSLRE